MIQVYTGEGKGKTTAALGLAVRAIGAGLKVYICQFLKGRCCCELITLKKLKDIKIEQFGKSCFIRKTPTKKDITSAQAGLRRVNDALRKRRYDVIILDEINVAVRLGLIKLNALTKIIKNTPKETELILTGRGAHPEIIKIADLVSDIKEKKHYYKSGLKARRGIEF